MSRPTPTEVYGLLLSLLDAEYQAETSLSRYGMLSDEHVRAGEILRSAPPVPLRQALQLLARRRILLFGA